MIISKHCVLDEIMLKLFIGIIAAVIIIIRHTITYKNVFYELKFFDNLSFKTTSIIQGASSYIKGIQI